MPIKVLRKINDSKNPNASAQLFRNVMGYCKFKTTRQSVECTPPPCPVETSTVLAARNVRVSEPGCNPNPHLNLHPNRSLPEFNQLFSDPSTYSPEKSKFPKLTQSFSVEITKIDDYPKMD